jgi:hypothetical protein
MAKFKGSMAILTKFAAKMTAGKGSVSGDCFLIERFPALTCLVPVLQDSYLKMSGR